MNQWPVDFSLPVEATTPMIPLPSAKFACTTLLALLLLAGCVTSPERQAAVPVTESPLHAGSLGVQAAPQLRLMNSLYPNGEPTPGQMLKVIQ